MANRSTLDPRKLFESELFNPMLGHELTDREFYVGYLLLQASKQRPLGNDDIRRSMQLYFEETEEISERMVKNIIRKLRKDHAFPIISSRTKPAGYWWCQSKEEMEGFIETFRSQALDELHTLSRIVKNNFPALAGQLTFEI